MILRDRDNPRVVEVFADNLTHLSFYEVAFMAFQQTRLNQNVSCENYLRRDNRSEI